MKSFRDPKYGERYEDVVLDLETALSTTVANNANQKKDGYRFVVANSGEVAPLISKIYLSIAKLMPKKQRLMNFSILIHQDQRKSGNLKLVVHIS